VEKVRKGELEKPGKEKGLIYSFGTVEYSDLTR
jgi:hypothetical protein